MTSALPSTCCFQKCLLPSEKYQSQNQREERKRGDQRGGTRPTGISTSPTCSDSKTRNASKLGPLFPNPSPELFLHSLLGDCPQTPTLPCSSLATPPPFPLSGTETTTTAAAMAASGRALVPGRPCPQHSACAVSFNHCETAMKS